MIRITSLIAAASLAAMLATTAASAQTSLGKTAQGAVVDPNFHKATGGLIDPNVRKTDGGILDPNIRKSDSGIVDPNFHKTGSDRMGLVIEERK